MGDIWTDKERTMIDDVVASHARLMILTDLAKQSDGRSNELLLERTLDAVGFRKPREWVRTQLRRLADLDAVSLDDVGSILVATIRRAGRDHVERRGQIDGIASPPDRN